MAENSDQAATRRRGPGRPFRKGQSGNPGGRRPVPPEVKEILLAADAPAAERLVGLLGSADEKVAFQAAKEILDRNHGKPTQAVDLDPGAGGALSFTIVRKVAG